MISCIRYAAEHKRRYDTSYLLHSTEAQDVDLLGHPSYVSYNPNHPLSPYALAVLSVPCE